MLKLTHRYASALLTIAEEEGLETAYKNTLQILLQEQTTLDLLSEHAQQLLGQITGGWSEITHVLYLFLDLARERMNMVQCEIISAVPLRPGQLLTIEQTLVRIFKKQLAITATVDPSLLGGLRVIIGDVVLDDTIKRKLSDMKNKIYEGVYFER